MIREGQKKYKIKNYTHLILDEDEDIQSQEIEMNEEKVVQKII